MLREIGSQWLSPYCSAVGKHWSVCGMDTWHCPLGSWKMFPLVHSLFVLLPFIILTDRTLSLRVCHNDQGAPYFRACMLAFNIVSFLPADHAFNHSGVLTLPAVSYNFTCIGLCYIWYISMQLWPAAGTVPTSGKLQVCDLALGSILPYDRFFRQWLHTYGTYVEQMG